MSADPVADYAAALDAVLHGPRAAKRRLIAEITDGFAHTIAAQRDAGGRPAPAVVGTDRPPDAAIDRALDEFGRPHELAPACQDELGVRQLRRTASTLVLAVGALLASWHLLWVHHPAGAGRDLALSGAVLTTVAALLASAALVATGRFGRLLPAAVTAVLARPVLVARVATAVSVLFLATSAALVGTASPAALVGCGVLAVVLHGTLASSARALRAAGRPGGVNRRGTIDVVRGAS